ncbi:hypothetical protein LVY72_14660 [Arthrobacter sp. I2-34]|uniref:NIPSNAP domain-containing protein n=1 Tax=Arthrobacter hankyongi TaxID=2904801 RepID=A0ABS9L901_9MICC|nr:hypothetical protein [Arthrobacter hankyongi]MCG2623140.1 hypothetical protein [Arthrobacter hankyongi]
MFTLRIEHTVRDFRMWMRAFDRDLLGRGAAGVRSYKISRPLDEKNVAILELDFDTEEAAAEFLPRLQNEVWKSDLMSQALAEAPVTKIVETIAMESLAAP